jgi:hypothetical protein
LFSFVNRHAHRLILDSLGDRQLYDILQGKLVPRDRAACGPFDRSFGFESQAKARFLQPYARKIDAPYENW